MTARCNPFIRSAAYLLLALALWAAPAALKAQDVKCPCDHYSVIIDPAVACKFTICYQLSPDGPIVCRVVGPGEAFKLPCPVYAAYIQLCDGTLFPFINPNPVISGRCTRILNVGHGCCVQACRSFDPAGCPVITIRPAICSVAGCPDDAGID